MSAEGTQPIGDLTATEQRQVQSVVDRMQSDMDRRFGPGEIPVEISVVGSAARGERRNVGSDLPIGHGPGTRSDIDYLAPRPLEPLFNAAHRNSPYQVDDLPHLDLPSFDRFQGLMTGAPHSGAPEIVFRAGQEPEVRAANPVAAEGTPRAAAASAGGDCPGCIPAPPSASQLARDALATGLTAAPPTAGEGDVQDPARAASGEAEARADDARATPPEPPRVGAADDPRVAAGVPDDAAQAFERARRTPSSQVGGELYAVGGTPDNPQFYRGTPDGQYLGTVDRVPRGAAEIGVSSQMIEMNNPGAPGRAFVADGEGRRYAIGPQGAAEVMSDGSLRTLSLAEQGRNPGTMNELARRGTGFPMGGRDDVNVFMLARARTAAAVIDGAQNQGDAHAAGLAIGGSNPGRLDVQVAPPRPPAASPFRPRP